MFNSWKRIALIALLGLFFESFALAEWKIADVGFRGDDFYIGILPENSGADFVYQISVCSMGRQRCEALNDCKYSESTLNSEMETIKDPKVRKDMEWVFLRSLSHSF